MKGDITVPGYRGHLIGGTAAFALTFYLFQNQCHSSTTAIQWLICALAGALFPDIDVKSKGQKYFYWVVLALLLIFLMAQEFELLAVCGITSIIPMLCKHRGLFHEPWFVVGLPATLWASISIAYPQYTQIVFFYALFFAIGALSHLYLDRGVKGILPRKKFKKLK